MAYLYHLVPDDMEGSVLYPLNALKDIFPSLYAAKSQKYEGRSFVMKQSIPTLGVAWNDVLHFTVVEPVELKRALVEAGMSPHEMKFYKIDPLTLEPAQTTIYLNNESSEKMSPENFVAYRPENLDAYASIPDSSKQYYKEMFANAQKPLLFHGIPHVLYKGSIDISILPVITI